MKANGAAALHSSPMTLDEWGAMDEDEPGELVDGFLVEEEVPDGVHEVVVGFLIHALTGSLRPLGAFVLGSEAKLAVGPRRGRKPDAWVYLPGRAPAARGVIRTPPDIAIEVVTPTARDARRDRVEKMDDYAAAGVRFYWIVDPQLRSIEIFERVNDGRYFRATAVCEGLCTHVPGVPQLSLDVDALWAEVDRLVAAAGE